MTRQQIMDCYMMNSQKVLAEMLYDTITKYEETIKDMKCCDNCNHNGIRYDKYDAEIQCCNNVSDCYLGHGKNDLWELNPNHKRPVCELVKSN